MASDKVVQHIVEQYLAAQRWMTDQPLVSYQTCLNGLAYFVSGPHLQEVRRVMRLQQARSGPRLVGVLRCTHQVSVRHFADDGMSCLIVDSQTERRMATYDYWTKQRINTQNLGSGTLVYRMALDPADKRWKLHEFIQELPTALETIPAGRLTVADSLAQPTRRDVSLLN